MTSPSLDGKIALVTGANQGIGLAIAKRLAAFGSSVILLARSADKLNEAYGTITRDYGGRHFCVVADVGRYDQVERAVHEAIEKYSTIDILVNNAGIAALGDIKDITPEHVESALRVNTLGPIHLYRALSPVFKRRQQGIVVDILSHAALRDDLTGNTVYRAGKLGHLGASLAYQTDHPFLRMFHLYPGPVKTTILSKVDTPLNRQLFQRDMENALDPDDVGQFVAELVLHPDHVHSHDFELQLGTNGKMEIFPLAPPVAYKRLE